MAAYVEDELAPRWDRALDGVEYADAHEEVSGPLERDITGLEPPEGVETFETDGHWQASETPRGGPSEVSVQTGIRVVTEDEDFCLSLILSNATGLTVDPGGARGRDGSCLA